MFPLARTRGCPVEVPAESSVFYNVQCRVTLASNCRNHGDTCEAVQRRSIPRRSQARSTYHSQTASSSSSLTLLSRPFLSEQIDDDRARACYLVRKPTLRTGASGTSAIVQPPLPCRCRATFRHSRGREKCRRLRKNFRHWAFLAGG